MPKPTSKARFAGPKGTRDLYPDDLLRQRYITQAWRDTAIRHGFDEIAGPTFETADLYAVKSGDGILGELFQAYSGKSPEEVEQVRETGRAPYALRPEFTPTIARMYAARAGSLPSPCRWFTAGPYFRAERPQRGRLREFLQWNCDVFGGEDAEQADADLIAVTVDLMASLGLRSGACGVRVNDRRVVALFMEAFGVAEDRHSAVLAFLDRMPKLSAEERAKQAAQVGLNDEAVRALSSEASEQQHEPDQRSAGALAAWQDASFETYQRLMAALDARLGLVRDGWVTIDQSIVRGLAYYTGTVFELIADGERAVAGGGRYDNLIELFGGPPTPAVGFGMGDVVLTNLLDDRKLMPEGAELRDAVSKPPASLRPEAFVFGANDEAADHVVRLVAKLRRGVEQADFDGKPWDENRYVVPPMHARKSDKATRNVGKLLKDASTQRARFAVIVESADKASVKDLGTGEQRELGLDEVPAAIAAGLHV